MSTDPSVVKSRIVLVALSDLYIPDWNPRKHLDEDELNDLMAYINKGGLIPPVLIWKGTGQAPYAVISGQRRSEAYRRLGRQQIEAEEMDITFEEAQSLADTSNNGVDPYWLDKYENWTRLMEVNQWSQHELGDKIGRAQSSINRGMVLLKVLNPASRALIRQNLKKGLLKTPNPLQTDQQLIGQTDPNTPGDQQLIGSPAVSASQKTKIKPLTEKAAYELTNLLMSRPLAEAQAMATEALGVMLPGRFNAPQAKALVASIKTGTPAHAHVVTPTPKKPKASRSSDPEPNADSHTPRSAQVPTPHASTLPPEMEDLVVELPAPRTTSSSAHSHTTKPASADSAPKESTPEMNTAGTGSSSGTGTTKALADSHINMESAQPNHGPRPVASPQASAGGLSTGETVVLDTLAGVSIIAKIKTKLKKGEKPTTAETLLLALHALWRSTAWLGKHGFKLVKWFVKETWKLSKASVKGTVKALGPAIARRVGFVFNIAIVLLFVWFGWNAYQHGIFYPFKVIGSLFHSKESPSVKTPPAIPSADSSQTAPVAEAPQQTSAAKPALAHHKKAPVTDNQTTVSSTVQATPAPGIAKAVVTPTVQKGPDVLGQVAVGAVGGAAKLFGL